MAYLSKQTVLRAYKVLSTLSADPLAQGATQRVSAIRYLLALDMFYRAHARPCDTQDRRDAAEFIENVGKVVSVNSYLYTTNFYTTLKDNPDYAVGSNFYSVNVVHESVANGGKRLEFPRRGSNPLMYVQSGKLYEDGSLIPNLRAYIHNDEHKSALVIWLLRNVPVGAGDYVEVQRALATLLTQPLIKQILPSANIFDVYCKKMGVTLTVKEKLEADDIASLFNNGAKGVTTAYTSATKVVDNIPQRGSSYGKDSFMKETFFTDRETDELETILRKNKNIILQGAPGVGKTWTARRIAYYMMGEADDSRIESIQFHQSYSYDSFIEGYRPDEDSFHLDKGVFLSFCEKVIADEKQRDYFFIIDEINRGNISKIMGELLSLIECGYRGKSHAMALSYSHEKFYVPSNLFIIGMMNTADRSLSIIDYALRRRFAFIQMLPKFDSTGFKAYNASVTNPKFKNVISAIKELNQTIDADPVLGEGFEIGHSYFCLGKETSDIELLTIIKYQIIPMLQEYWFDNVSKAKEESRKLLDALK